MTATVVTQEQLMFFNSMSQSYLNNFNLVGNDQLFNMIDIIRQQHGDPATATDETRIVKKNIEKSTGTVDTVSSAGAYSSTDFAASRTPMENIVTLTEQGGTYSLARRNTGKLRRFIASIVLTPEGKADAQKRFLEGGYGDIIVDEMRAKMRVKVMTALKTLLEAADSTGTVYGDVVIAASGTTFNFDNLITGDIGDTNTTYDLIIEALAGQSNQNGDPLTFTAPKIILCSPAKQSAVIREYKQSMVVNELDRNNIDYWNSDVLIVPIDFTTSTDAFVLTGQMPLVFYSETPQPEVFMGFDEHLNAVLHISWIFAFGWESRCGIVKVEAGS